MSQRVMEPITSQRWSTVVMAELRRHVGSRRTQVTTVAIASLGILGGLSALAFVAAFDPQGTTGTGGSVPAAMETAGGVVAILMALSALAAASGETSDGTVLSSLLVVPNRTRLLAARAVAPMVVAAVTGILAAVVVLATGVGLSGGAQIHLELSMLCLAATAAAVPLTTLLGFLTGTVVRRGAPAMAIAMVALIVLPLVVGAAQLAAPPSLGPALNLALATTPGVAVMQALSVTTAEPGAMPVAITGLGVLVAWAAVLAVGAHVRFRREGHNA